MPDAVLTCFILSAVNIVILLVTSAVISRRNCQVISRMEALEIEVKGRSGGRNAHPWRGKENFDQHGSSLSLSDSDMFVTLTPSSPPFEDHQHEANRCVKVELHPLSWRGKENCDQHGSSLSLSDPDMFGTLTPSSPPFEYHQQEANRCAKVELLPPSADIVRSSVDLPPVVSASRLGKRSPGVSRHSTDLEGGAPPGVSQLCRLDTVPEEGSL